jgi:DNA-binding CsgD family transcriptional regulator
VPLPAGPALPGRGLPPRLREVFHRLLSSDGEKQSAAALGMSPHTLHGHAKRLYTLFGGVRTVELMAQMVRIAATPPTPATSRRKHLVKLTVDQRECLLRRVSAIESASDVLRARILLMPDGGATDAVIAN